jgi:murein DD-endopeptidase MepM/ murein hydrolase activator NlpD
MLLLRIGVALLIVAAAAVFAAQGSWPWRRLGDSPSDSVGTAPVLPLPTPTWVASDTLRSGEALGDLFARHGIGAVDLPSVLELLGLDPRRVRSGSVFRFGHADSAAPSVDVTIRTHPEEETRVSRSADGWAAERLPIRWLTEDIRLEGTIETSLFDALTAAAMSAPVPAQDRIRLAWDLADVFAWAVDFSRDLQPNDRFAVLFQRHKSELGESRLGDILASDLEVDNRRLTAFRFETRAGRSEYFDEEGESLQRAFLRAPVAFRRIASGFTRSRRHPILGIWRRHEGIDFAAASGTEVVAAGDGTVSTAGWSGGYGRMVEIRHQNGITTRYAHLRGFARGIARGSKVQQGDVIGYVGSSGLATAAHLHYEFRQSGVARDPGQVDMGAGRPVPGELRSAFLLERDRLRALLRPVSPPADPLVASDR